MTDLVKLLLFREGGKLRFTREEYEAAQKYDLRIRQFIRHEVTDELIEVGPGQSDPLKIYRYEISLEEK